MSNGRVAEYIVKLVGQNAQLMGQLNQANAGLSQMTNQAGIAARANGALNSTLKSLTVTALSAFSVVEVYRFTKACVSAYEASEKSLAKVAQAIKTTGGIAGFSLQQLSDIAADFQHNTLFEDDTIMNDVTAQLLTFTNIAGTNFKRAQVAALDLSTVLGSDLKGQTIQLGKALENPVAGVTALSRAGVTFTDTQKAVIKSLMDTNQLGAAQTIILDEIANKYGGQAEAAAKASTGVTQLANSFGDLMEKIGGAIANSDTFKDSIKDLGTMTEVMASSDYTGLEKFFALLDPWADKTLELKKVLAETAKAQAHINQMDKDAAAGKKPVIAAIVEKTRALDDVKAELTAALEEQGKLNSLDLKAVAASNLQVSALTAEKEALEKLYAVQKPREKIAKLAPMEQRLDVKAVVSGKKADPLAGLRIKPQVTYESDTLKDYSKELGIITQKQLLYGNALGTVIAKKEATQAAIDGLLNEGYAAESLEVQKLMGVMDQYNAQQTQIQGISEKTKETLSQMGSAFSTLGSGIGGAAGDWVSFAGTLLESIPQLITQITALVGAQVAGSTASAVATGAEAAASGANTLAKGAEAAAIGVVTAAKITSAVTGVATAATEVAASGAVTAAKTTETFVSGAAGAAKMPFPASLIALALVIGTIGAVLASVPKAKKFANGGIISGPTLGLMGEYPGASNNPEVVAPLSKLKGMINDRSGAMDISVQDIVLTGSQLRIIQKATSRQLSSRS